MPELTHTECVEWPYCRLQSGGYGGLSPGNRHTKETRVHRAAWEVVHGPIPEGLEICHHCDNPPCFRVTLNRDPRLSHLFLGTRADNHQDMRQKQRSRLYLGGWRNTACQGEKGSKSKLNAEQVAEVVRLYKIDGWNQSKIGRHFGISQAAVWLILNGKNWKHLNNAIVNP